MKRRSILRFLAICDNFRLARFAEPSAADLDAAAADATADDVEAGLARSVGALLAAAGDLADRVLLDPALAASLRDDGKRPRLEPYVAEARRLASLVLGILPPPLASENACDQLAPDNSDTTKRGQQKRRRGPVRRFPPPCTVPIIEFLAVAPQAKAQAGLPALYDTMKRAVGHDTMKRAVGHDDAAVLFTPTQAQFTSHLSNMRHHGISQDAIALLVEKYFSHFETKRARDRAAEDFARAALSRRFVALRPRDDDVVVINPSMVLPPVLPLRPTVTEMNGALATAPPPLPTTAPEDASSWTIYL